MSWSTPFTAVDAVAFSAASANATLRDNFNELAVAKAEGIGNHIVVDATNSVAARSTRAGSDISRRVVSNASYTTVDDDGNTLGPTISGVCSFAGLVSIRAIVDPGTRCAVSFSGTADSGAIAASDDRAMFLRGTWTSATGHYSSSIMCNVAITGAYEITPSMRSISGTSEIVSLAMNVWEL